MNDMCVDDQILSSYIDGELSEPWKSQLEEHLEWCEACRIRYANLKKISEVTQKAVLEDSDIGFSQNRVMKYLNANVINKPKHTFLQKARNLFRNKVFLPAFTAVASFCFCLIIFSSPDKVTQISPDTGTTSLSIENITPVRTSDNYTTSNTLSKYSLEEIIQYLDSEGYDVTVSYKPLIGLNLEEEVHKTIEPSYIPFSISYQILSGNFDPYLFTFNPTYAKLNN